MKSSSEDIELEAAEVLPDLNDDFEEDSGNESSQRATSSNRAYHNLETFQRKNLRQKVRSNSVYNKQAYELSNLFVITGIFYYCAG
jgi:hypothetical protein